MILDTSVMINLIASGRAYDILKALKITIIMEEITAREVGCNPRNNQNAQEDIQQLINAKILTIEKMDEAAFEIFYGLVGAPSPNDLDDGEAATLAQAWITNSIAAIDEKKGNKIANLQYPSLPRCNSLDIFAFPNTAVVLGDEGLTIAVYEALRYGRMRVPQEFDPWVRVLIGPEHASNCLSLKQLKKI